MDQLITFLEIAKQNSFRQAALRLNLTQPAVSAQIRNLEAELECLLFHRHRVSLTPAGKEFLPFARQMIALWEEGKKTVLETQDLLQGNVTIGISSGVALTVLPRLLRYFRDTRPKVKITAHTLPVEETIQGIEEGQLDAGILYGQKAGPTLQSQTLFYDNLILISPVDHPVSAHSFLSLNQLRQLPLISLTPNTPERQWLDQLFHKAGIYPEIIIELSSVEEVKRMVREGLGPALVPLLSLDPSTDENVRRIRVPELTTQLPVTLLYPQGPYLSLSLQRILDDIQGIYPTTDS
ncbi:LysR family transcriptional regulator [Kroppenstedtia pulmonis]|uniref:LysR family transcriptional regulator n=1 Tax=Kroppenstedtia pulmonis TaxID=1380685 RepID=A0A7D3YAX3_9BACL|nr:LysR family transcriptional regulator [Kroppenstedtia pulmonis]QKG85201.1 LysR family transcriptional regulator [Kroppenstedtia pulmonis]